MNGPLTFRHLIPFTASGRIVEGLALLLIVFAVGGCQSAERGGTDAFAGRGASPAVYVDPSIGPEIRRVFVLPVRGMDDPESAAEMRAVFAEELQRSGRFAVLLPDMGKLAVADAVLRIDVLSYHPYKPIAIGVRATLARARNGEVLWAVDDHFHAGDPDVARSAIRFGRDRYRRARPASGGESILLSPTRFAHFVAAALFNTLPPLAESVSEDAANP